MILIFLFNQVYFRLQKAKYFCRVGLENKAEPLKALLNRIEEVDTLINVELKAKKKAETSFRTESFKRPSSTLVYSSASKKSNIMSKDIFGPEVQYLKVSHTVIYIRSTVNLLLISVFSLFRNLSIVKTLNILKSSQNITMINHTLEKYLTKELCHAAL